VSVDKHRLQDIIQSDLDGELSAAERAELASLLLQDPQARRLHDEYRKVDTLLRSIPAAEPPPDFQARLLARIPRPGWSGAGQRVQGDFALYRIAAVFAGGLLIAGLGYLVLQADVQRPDLQGSVNAALAARESLSLRSEGIEVGASLERDGESQRLRISVTTAIPCQIVASTNPATTIYAVDAADGAQLEPGYGGLSIHVEPGTRSLSLDIAGQSPVQLELRAGGKLLAKGSVTLDGR